jgi:hypothetical protein
MHLLQFLVATIQIHTNCWTHFWMNKFVILFLIYINIFENNQVRVDTLAVRIAAGFRPPLFSKDTYRQKNENLLNVLRDVGGPQNPIEFLTSCSYYISFNT